MIDKITHCRSLEITLSFLKENRFLSYLIGTAGSSSTQINAPRAITFDSRTNIFYVSDPVNNRVMGYTLNSTVGTLIAGGNGAGTSTTQLNNPRGLYIDYTTNSLVIANPGANNVVRWVIGASSWTLVAGNMNGSTGNIPTALNSPWDVTLDPMGNIYVADRFNHRIQFFLAGQMNGTSISGLTGVFGSSSMMLREPEFIHILHRSRFCYLSYFFNNIYTRCSLYLICITLSVALDSQLNVYVADSLNARIQKFAHY